MFSPVVLPYRAGVRITFAGKHYYFTRKYFMQKFASFIKLRNSLCKKRLKRSEGLLYLKSFDDFYLASLSIYDQGCDGDLTDSAVDDYLWKFDIAGRRVECDHNSDRYMRDLDLSRAYPNQFKDRGASYLEMAKFIDGDDVSISGVEIARQMMKVFSGQQNRVDDCPLIPSILAAWFIAESSRSPVVFLPSLLLLDLISRRAPCSTMGVYTMINSLTNPHLLPKARSCSDPMECIFMKNMGLFNRYDLDRQERAEASSELADVKVYIRDEDRFFYNVGRQNNGSREPVDRSEIKPSDALVRSAGWQAMSARFSFLELSVTDPKQQALDVDYLQCQDRDYALKEEPNSNVKSFATMVDWLWSRGAAMPLHVNTIQTLSGQVKFDQESEAHILDKVFSTLMEKAVEILNTDDVLVFTDDGLMNQNDANHRVFLERACESIFPEFTDDCNDEGDFLVAAQEDDLSSDENSEYDENDVPYINLGEQFICDNNLFSNQTHANDAPTIIA